MFRPHSSVCLLARFSKTRARQIPHVGLRIRDLPLQRGVVLKWFYSLRRRNTFVGGTCALLSALLVVVFLQLKNHHSHKTNGLINSFRFLLYATFNIELINNALNIYKQRTTTTVSMDCNFCSTACGSPLSAFTKLLQLLVTTAFSLFKCRLCKSYKLTRHFSPTSL